MRGADEASALPVGAPAMASAPDDASGAGPFAGGAEGVRETDGDAASGSSGTAPEVDRGEAAGGVISSARGDGASVGGAERGALPVVAPETRFDRMLRSVPHGVRGRASGSSRRPSAPAAFEGAAEPSSRRCAGRPYSATRRGSGRGGVMRGVASVDSRAVGAALVSVASCSTANSPGLATVGGVEGAPGALAASVPRSTEPVGRGVEGAGGADGAEGGVVDAERWVVGTEGTVVDAERGVVGAEGGVIAAGGGTFAARASLGRIAG